jgi:hypothetical protein
MYPDNQSPVTGSCRQQVQELEDAYAQALADNMDAQGLSILWERIKALKRRISLLRENPVLRCMGH